MKRAPCLTLALLLAAAPALGAAGDGLAPDPGDIPPVIELEAPGDLHAWTRQMGPLWFPVLSDFWPHGAVAERYGVLRSDGVSERALFIVDQRGLIRYLEVSDINRRLDLETCIGELEKLEP